MALDQTRIGDVITQQMEAIDRDYGDSDGEHAIGAVITIVQVLTREADGVKSDVRVRHNIPDPYLAMGVLRAADQILVHRAAGAD